MVSGPMSMQMKLDELLEQLFLADDYARLITEIVDRDIISHARSISLVFDHAKKCHTEAQRISLAQFVAHLCVKKQSLESIDRNMKSIIDADSNASEKEFMKRCLCEIGEWLRRRCLFLARSCHSNMCLIQVL